MTPLTSILRGNAKHILLVMVVIVVLSATTDALLAQQPIGSVQQNKKHSLKISSRPGVARHSERKVHALLTSCCIFSTYGNSDSLSR